MTKMSRRCRSAWVFLPTTIILIAAVLIVFGEGGEGTWASLGVFALAPIWVLLCIVATIVLAYMQSAPAKETGSLKEPARDDVDLR
jgi:hypothetical protein